jgi:hypothetical protein
MRNTTESALLEQHAGLLFQFDSEGFMTTANEPDGDRAPRVFLVRGRTTHLVRYRDDVPLTARDDIDGIAAGLAPWTGEPTDAVLLQPIRDRLARDGPIHDEERGPAFEFGERVELAAADEAVVIDEATAHLLERNFPYTRSVLPWLLPVVGVVRDGAVVSACYSSRKSASACEAGVYTEEPWRGHGFAPLVVATWRREVERIGAQPLYSTSWDNVASLAVARRLGLRAYAESVSVT